MPTVTYKGNDHVFPDDWDNDKIRTALMRYDVMNPSTNLPNPTQPSSAENPIPQSTKRGRQSLATQQFVGSLIPAAGATVGSLVGPGGGIGGAMLGSVLKQKLQEGAPEFFGEAPSGTGGTISDIVKDTLSQGAAPELLSMIPGLGKYLISKVTSDNPILSKYINNRLANLTGSESNIVTKAASRVQQNLPNMGEFTTTSELPTKLTDTSGNPITKTLVEPSAETQRTVLRRYLALPPGKQTGPVATYINKTADETMADVTQVRNLKLTAGADITQQLALNKAVRTGVTSSGKFDIDAIQKEMADNPDTYKEALNPTTKATFDDFLAKAKELEPEKSSGGVNSLLGYFKHRLAFNVIAGTAGAIAGHSTGIPAATEAGVVGTVYLGNKALSALMNSPTMGKLAIQALETPKTGEAAGVISKALLYGLRGTDLDFVDSKGNKEKMQVSQDGQLQLKP